MLDASFADCLKSHRNVEKLSRSLVKLLPKTVSTRNALPLVGAALLHPQRLLPVFDVVSNDDAPYVDNLQTLRSVIDWKTNRVRPERCRSYIVSPVTDDVLVSPTPVIKSLGSWGPLALLTHAALSLVKPTRKAAVVATMRDDGVSILEFVSHYRALGFDEIFIYSNDNGDGSDEILRQLAIQKIICFVENRTSGTVSPQEKAFAHSLHFLPELRDFEWVFYADSDEMLVPGEEFDFSISKVLSIVSAKYSDNLPSAICYQWKWFNSDYALYRSKGLLLERFPFCDQSSPRLIKSIVRIADVMSMQRLHFPKTYPGTFFVDPSLNIIEESRSANQESVWNYAGDGHIGGAVNHYWCKSFEEFVVKKRRGDKLEIVHVTNEYKRAFLLFFTWNGSDAESSFSPPSPVLLARVKMEMLTLLRLPDIADVHDQVEHNFRSYVRRLLGSISLEELYIKTHPTKFDEAGYLEANPDVAEAVAAGLCSSGEDHFYFVGRREGRLLRPGFRAPPLALPFPPEISASRRDKALTGLDLATMRGVEIGALAYPLVWPSEGDIFYVDFADTDTLKQNYADNGDFDVGDLVHVDAVWGTNSLAECVGFDNKFHYVIASHVIEHVPDFVTWIAEVNSILKDGGEVRLVIPDRRYTYDYLRFETRIHDVLDAYIRKARVPGPRQIIEFFSLARIVNATEAWDGTLDVNNLAPMNTTLAGMQLAEMSLATGAYNDLHCWVFTPRTFAELCVGLAEIDLLPFECAQFFDTERYNIEFVVHLKASTNKQATVDSWRSMRDSLPVS